MSQVCPNCQKTLDPTHAPIARVHGAKIITYCSVLCADKVRAESESDIPSTPLLVTKIPKSSVLTASFPLSKATADSASSTENSNTSVAKAKSKKNTASLESLDSSGMEEKPAAKSKSVFWLASFVCCAGCFVLVFLYTKRSNVPAENNDSSQHATTQKLAAKVAFSAEEVKVVISPEKLREAAIKELEGFLKNGSGRYQRLAAIALTPLSHELAVKVLSELLQTEESELSRIDIAYGLSVAGFEIGDSYLLSGLKSKRRDVRMDAARRLAQRGNNAGKATLQNMLGVRSHRLGAAQVLAQLGDSEGIAILREEFEGSSSSDETRMRAAVGLGLSGDKLPQEELRRILKEGRYVVDAAGALAVLGDKIAIPALKRQLQLTAMRVDAAKHLKQLGVEADLRSLSEDLVTGNAEGRISVAEAVLILTALKVDK